MKNKMKLLILTAILTKISDEEVKELKEDLGPSSSSPVTKRKRRRKKRKN